MVKPSDFRKNAALTRFLLYIPQDVATSFTERQLQGIQQALQTTPWRQHELDMRFTVWSPWQRYYLVLVGGRERRSPERLKQEALANSVWRPANLLLAFSFFCVSILAFIGLISLPTHLLDTSPELIVHPTGTPFKADQQSCEESGRIWQDNECIDYEHDPNF